MRHFIRRALKSRFVKSKDGASAVEFAIVSVPFFFLMFATIEISMYFFASVALENGVFEATRLIRTGQLQTSGGGLTEFMDELCAETHVLIDCDGELYIDVRTFDQFGSTSFGDPLDGGALGANFTFSPGTQEEIVLVRAFYVWPLHTPIISSIFSNYQDGARLISSSAAFRNEPFGE